MSHLSKETVTVVTGKRQGAKRAVEAESKASAVETSAARTSPVATSSVTTSAIGIANSSQDPRSEWALTEPSDKDMGLVRLTLDKGVKTTAIGQLYGLDFEIEGEGFSVRVFFDHYN